MSISGGGYDGEPSLFDEIAEDDLVIAFFPCTRFEAQISLFYRGKAYQQQKWDDTKKLEYAMNLHDELAEMYKRLSQMTAICIQRNIKLIIENPYTQPHYLTSYWCMQPAIIDKDRRINGDYYKKPTQYWFINLEPKSNVLFEPVEEVEERTINKCSPSGKYSRQVMRSMIHPQYANRFIRTYILGGEDE